MYYLYQHQTLDGVTFYIGKGTKNKNRSYKGYQRAYSKQQRTKNWKEFAKNGYKVEIIEESEDLNSILNREDELWANCKTCVNKQNNKRFKDFKVVKINENVGILYVFKKTYIIFNTGEVYNFLGEKLELSKHNNNYLILTVSNGSTKRKNFYVHRLIADIFIPNFNNYPNVNHKDLNRQNNNYSNLEWCSQEQNIQHSIKLNSYIFKEKIKKVLQFDLNGKFIKEWDRAKTAANFYNCTEELIQQACQQKNIEKTKTGKKFIWIYKEDYENNVKDKFNKTVKQKLTKEENY